MAKMTTAAAPIAMPATAPPLSADEIGAGVGVDDGVCVAAWLELELGLGVAVKVAVPVTVAVFPETAPAPVAVRLTYASQSAPSMGSGQVGFWHNDSS